MPPKPTIRRLEELPWLEPPGHFGAYSKLLINPETASTERLDFRISLYPPSGLAADHVHQEAEHVYYFLGGKGLLTLDGEPRVVEAGVAVWIPPGVRHQLESTGVDDLLFVVVTTPAGELPLRSKTDAPPSSPSGPGGPPPPRGGRA
jgi:mannose-6-phosphate isomerase-like protein (cupin superfamily)